MPAQVGLQRFGNLVTFGGESHTTTMEILTEVFTSPLTYITLFAAVAGIGLAYLVYYKQRISSEVFVATSAGRGMQKLLQNRYYIDAAYRGFGLHVGTGIAAIWCLVPVGIGIRYATTAHTHFVLGGIAWTFVGTIVCPIFITISLCARTPFCVNR